MTDYYIQVTNLNFPGGSNPDLIEYQFEAIQNLDQIKESGYTVASAEQSSNSVAYNFSPPKVNIPINWLVINGENRSQLTVDKSRGTLESSGIGAADDRFTSTDSSGNYIVKTIEEQILWLREYIFNGTGGTQWRLYGGNFDNPDGDSSNTGSPEGTPVFIKNTRLPQNVQNLNAQNANIELGIGNVV